MRDCRRDKVRGKRKRGKGARVEVKGEGK